MKNDGNLSDLALRSPHLATYREARSPAWKVGNRLITLQFSACSNVRANCTQSTFRKNKVASLSTTNILQTNALDAVAFVHTPHYYFLLSVRVVELSPW